MNVLIAGGTGFVGRRVADAMLERGDRVTVVSRDPVGARARGRREIQYRGWLPAVDGFDAVVNLAGSPIFGRRWNDRVKSEIRSSRVESTDAIVAGLLRASNPPPVLVNASAIGFYGDRGEEPLAETAPCGDDFLAGVCKAWERAARKSPVRTVRLRIGVVLGPDGGVLETMLPPFRAGLGGSIGLGRRYFSWIHIDDVVGLVLHAIDNDLVEGAVNATAAEPVRNREFTKMLGRVLGRPTLLPVPPLGLRVMFGEVARVMASSQRCLPEKAQATGYRFRYHGVEAALRDVLGR